MALAAHNAMDGAGPIPRARSVYVWIAFYMPRPASLPKRQTDMVKRPDIDKLGRACLDALTDVCFEDDSQVINLYMYKRYAGTLLTPEPGAHIEVGEANCQE